MTDRLIETFSAPKAHRVDLMLPKSDLLQERALTVYAHATGCRTFLGLSMAECGVADGQTALGLSMLLPSAAQLFLFDVFDVEPLAARNNLAATAVQTHARPLKDVQDYLAACDGVVFKPGLFNKTLPVFHERLGFVHADGDLYESTCDIIDMVERNVVVGGVVVFDDYGTEWTGVTRAVDEKLSKRWHTTAIAGVGQLVAYRLS